MQIIFELCEPRDEVLRGVLSEDVFAARLKDVLDQHADPVYGNPATFFDNTYPTSGLRTLLNEALGRLIGNAAGKNAVIRLETAFGGGKTHNLIALYHVASGKTPFKSVANLLDKSVQLPKPGQIKIAGVVGSDLDPTVGINHPEDGVKTHTLWGELAYQLGGRAGYALARESDENKSAPGTGLFEELVGDKPTLIMLDELARHLEVAAAVPTATKKSTLADQVIAFLMSLLEFASSKEHCLVVLTLAGPNDAFAAQTAFLRQKLAEAASISARQERVLTPTDETEISAIVTHRLFKSVNRNAIAPVVQSYNQYYGSLVDKNAEIPQRAVRAEYAQEMERAYPFHPELLVVLNRKTATIPNFNQTRGALRLLAWTVQSLWLSKPEGTWMIHPHHLDLSQSQIAEDLTSRLDRPKFKQVIEADIVSSMVGMLAHAQADDESLTKSGKPPYARRLATTIFLHSLTQGIASGVAPQDLMLAVLEPDGEGGGDDPAVVKRALDRLYEHAWFLEYDGHRYRFKTEPSLNKIILDEIAQVGATKAKAEIEQRVRQIWKKGYFKPVYFPLDPSNIDDDAEAPKLAIVHFDAVAQSAASDELPALVRKLNEYSGSLETFRRYQNNVLFLVADSDQVDNMVMVVRRYLAIGRIIGDPDRLNEFNEEQRKALKKMQEAAELDVRIAITKAYRYLYYPTSDAAKEDGYLRRETLPADEQGDVEKDQTNVVLRLLRTLKKVQTADDEVLAAQYVKSKAWDQNQQSMSTEDLRKAFARKVSLRFLLDVGQLPKTIQNGIQTKTWLYYDSGEQFAYDQDSPPTKWQISDSAILYTPQEAARLQLRIKGKWKPPVEQGEAAADVPRCPVCGYPEAECICGVTVVGKKAIPAKLQGAGAVSQAFQMLTDEAEEYGITHLRQIFIRIEGAGKQGAADMRALGLAIPQFGKGVFTVDQHLIAEFGKGEDIESLEQKYRGGWERYKRIKSVSDALSQEADSFRVTWLLGAEFKDGLEVGAEQFQTIRDVLVTLDVSKITIEAVPLIPAETKRASDESN